MVITGGKSKQKTFNKGKSNGPIKGKRKAKAVPDRLKSKHKSDKSKHKDDSDESDFEEVAVNLNESQGFPQNVQNDGDSEDDLSKVGTKDRTKAKNKKMGGFQAMGLSHAILTGITRKGYKIPTPIQRKTIPLILDGKDVVAMARTGSGKTAAFLVPMFERLQQRTGTVGARAVILAPTRELALQTLKFAKDLGKYTGLKAAVILGGDSMEDQFAALHENPDIIIATPGRFMHVCVEMELKLTAVQYLVFDEADRLFEMGFQEQLHEILRRVPESRQTLLFSATLPKLLVEFARAGLHDPTLVRLDVDSKLSENLQTAYVGCRSEDKLHVLLYLLKTVIKAGEQTVIFAATKHHVEYLNLVLMEAGYTCSSLYSSMDQTARKIQVGKFRKKLTTLLLVTDLAARGIDIPMLDNVINYNFPATAKLFVHRVGRVARAGRSGAAYSIVSPDEVPLMLDLHLALGRPMKYVLPGKTYVGHAETDGLYGRVPQTAIDSEDANVRTWNSLYDIQSLRKTIDNAYKNYLKSRPLASKESIKRMKEREAVDLGYHPVFGVAGSSDELARCNLLESMKSFKPKSTIFEINSTSKADGLRVMQKKRGYHSEVIERAGKKADDIRAAILGVEEEANGATSSQPMEQSSSSDIQATFSKVVAPRYDEQHDAKKQKKKKKRGPIIDEENYVSYQSKDYHSEKAMSSGFERDAAGATMDIAGDDADEMRRINNALKWDRKRKRYVAETGKELQKKKIKTESGQWISASYKSNAYKEWLSKSKIAERETAADSGDDEESVQKPRQQQSKYGLQVVGGGFRRGFHKQGMPGFPTKQQRKQSTEGAPKKPPRQEIKSKDLILKERKIKAKKQATMKHRTDMRKKKHAMKGKKGGKR